MIIVNELNRETSADSHPQLAGPMTCQWQLLPASWRLNPHSTFLQQNDYWKKLRSARLIECDFHEHFVSKAGSVISSKSPSPAFRWSMYYTELEIDRYIGLPIFFSIFKHFTIIGYRLKKKKTIFFFLFFLLVTYTIIQSITSSEMCSLHLTHPSAHTWSSGNTHTHTHTLGAVGTVHSGEAPARPPHVTLYKIHLFETC